jgi:Na+/proline symporter
VVITDLILFVASMTGAIATAWITVSLPQVGGMSGLLAHPAVAERLAFLPDFSNREVALTVFVIPLAVQWWSVWYPGSEPGGGGYVAQRMLAAKDENNAVGAVLLFQVAHYALRPWPWILVALASLVVFPDLAAIQAAFPDIDQSVVRHDLAYPAMLTFLPAGLLGLVLASLAAAYMSTMSSQLNWGSSYLVNDFYQRFVRPDAPERELVLVGRISTIILMLLACTMALYLESAMQAFNILLTIGAGTGLLFLLRWFWWRINAFSEIAAMAVSFMVALWFEFGTDGAWAFHHKLLIGIGLTTAAWLAATFVAPGTDDRTLETFYRLIRPSGPGWQRVRAQLASAPEPLPTAPPRDNIPQALMNIFLGCIGTYGALFATGSFLYGQLPMAGLLGAIAVIAFFLLLRGRYI